MIVQVCELNHLGHRAQRISPSRYFRLCGRIAIVFEERLGELSGDLVPHRVLDKGHRHPGVEAHSQSSVYFLLDPRAFSTGYFLELSAIFSDAAAKRSIS